MSAKKFKFVSPGVFLSEIDNSQLPKAPGGIGPAIIGRTRRGPALKPIKVSSFQEFVEIFGEPIPGNEGEDPWRDGNGLLATAYAPLAAQAYLKANINSPVTVVRLLGVQGDDASDSGQAGWEVTNAFGLFVAPSASNGITGSLVGIVYTDNASFEVGVTGLDMTASAVTNRANSTGTSVTSPVIIENNRFRISLHNGSKTLEKAVSFRKGSKYIREELNTNPVLLNDQISEPPAATLAADYFLGETFEEEYEKVQREATALSKGLVVWSMKLTEGLDDFKSANHQLSEAKSGWVIPQYNGTPGTYDPTQLERLFRFCALQEGEQGNDFSIKIENIKIADPGEPDKFGRFDVSICQHRAGRITVVENFSNLNLNPNSDNFIARKIGDQYPIWDPAENRNKLYGDYVNRSSFVRVEMAGQVGENGPSNPASVPFGFLGPIVPGDVLDSSLTNGIEARFDGAGNWVTGAVNFPDSEGSADRALVRLRWPTSPHVITSSLGTELSPKYAMGGLLYNTSVGSAAGTINFASPNPGMKDHSRRYGTYGTLVTDQIDGIADGTNKHSYIFSLDEVVVTGAVNLSNDMSSFNPTIVEFISGSHRGTKKASASINFTNGDAATAGNSITIRALNVDGATTTPATFTSHGSTQNATTFSRASSGNGAAGLVSSIEASPIASLVTVSRNGTIVTIKQKTGGDAGNTAITSNMAHVTINGGDAAADGAFTGGSTSKTAYTAHHSASIQLSASSLLSVVDSFTMPMVGGFDGVNILEADPFNMRASTSGKPTAGPDATTRNSYAYASIDRAIELIRDPEALEMNLASIPGVTNASLTQKLVQVCEARGDSLAIIDLPDVYIPPSQKICTSFQQRVNNTTPAKSARALKARQLNSSYGATYYPWVKVRDTINSRNVWAPPSVIALGVMAYTEQRNDVWFAPAGFNRGGLNEGNAGLPVLQVSEQLLSSQRDTLYEANINPIASFVSEGLVVFGQKTLQMTPSALDRINVRRLLIFVKKEVSRIANTLIFDNNVPATWNRFTGQVVPFLESVQTRLGLTDFKVVLDSTTTTPDLIDRNVMYAKIFLKPARSIEFIAVDFVITRTGASFDD